MFKTSEETQVLKTPEPAVKPASNGVTGGGASPTDAKPTQSAGAAAPAAPAVAGASAQPLATTPIPDPAKLPVAKQFGTPTAQPVQGMGMKEWWDKTKGEMVGSVVGNMPEPEVNKIVAEQFKTMKPGDLGKRLKGFFAQYPELKDRAMGGDLPPEIADMMVEWAFKNPKNIGQIVGSIENKPGAPEAVADAIKNNQGVAEKIMKAYMGGGMKGDMAAFVAKNPWVIPLAMAAIGGGGMMLGSMFGGRGKEEREGDDSVGNRTGIMALQQ